MKSFATSSIAAILLLCALVHGGIYQEPRLKTLIPISELSGQCAAQLSGVELRVVFGLKQENLDELERQFWEVSTPSHPNYGKHRTFDEVNELIAPHEDNVISITSWLVSNGVSPSNVYRHAAKDHLVIKVPVSIAERLFDTKFTIYRDSASGTYSVAAASKLKFPDNLVPHIQAVFSSRTIDRPSECSELAFGTKPVPAPAQYVPETADSSPTTKLARSAPGYVDTHLAAIQATTAPFPVWFIGNYHTVAYRCPDGSWMNSSLYCGNVKVASLTISGYNYNTGASLGGWIYNVGGSTPCNADNGDSYCALKLAAWGFDTSKINVGYFQPTFSVPDYTGVIFEYYLTLSNGTNSPTYRHVYPIVGDHQATIPEIKNQYSLPYNESGTNPRNSQGVIELGQPEYSESDLKAFFADAGLPDYSGKVVITGTQFVPNTANPDTEAQLDIELIMAFGLNITTYFYADNGTTGYDWVTEALNQPNGYGLVQSISYGTGAGEYAQDTTYFDIEFQKAGLKGVSVLTAGGDNGLYDNIYTGLTPSQVRPYPTEPSCSSYATVVSSTMFLNNGTNLVEILANSKYGSYTDSGAAFTKYSTRPAYQDAAMQNYLSNYVGPVPQNLFNTSNRAYPDVVALGLNVRTVIGGQIQSVTGSSASTPIFAGVIALLNDIRLNAGLSPLGFLNPWLYSLPADAFNDVTFGENACTTNYCGPFGFSAAPGYDAPTGLGSPNFEKMAQYVRAVASASTSSSSASARVASSSSSASASVSTSSSSASARVSTSTSSASAKTTSTASIKLSSSASVATHGTSTASTKTAATTKAVTTIGRATSATAQASTSTSIAATKVASNKATTTSSASIAATKVASNKATSSSSASIAATKVASNKATTTSSASIGATRVASTKSVTSSSTLSTANARTSTSSTLSAASTKTSTSS